MATIKATENRALRKALKDRETRDVLSNAHIRNSLKSNLDRVTELERIVELMELDKKSLMADVGALRRGNTELRERNLKLGGLAGASSTIKSAVLAWLEVVEEL